VRRDLEQVTDRYVLYLPGPWPIRARPDDFTVSTELTQRTYGLTMSWLMALQLQGPGRYGRAPADLVTKVEPLSRPEQERLGDLADEAPAAGAALPGPPRLPAPPSAGRPPQSTRHPRSPPPGGSAVVDGSAAEPVGELGDRPE
jgi:hypothetical protein